MTARFSVEFEKERAVIEGVNELRGAWVCSP